VVDALEEQAIDKHLQSVIDNVGRVDISFNAIGIPDKKVLGLPLAEMDVTQFSLPLATYVNSYFLTARLAARRMVPNKSGVIMTVSALPARMGSPMNGGYGPAQASYDPFREQRAPMVRFTAICSGLIAACRCVQVACNECW
jgi:NAD(P)-dependent dehydrogenase (short-subunit alcohol dehydrogenase family)